MLSRRLPPLVATTLLLGAIGSLSCSKETASPPKGERPLASPSTGPQTVATPVPPPTRTALPDGLVDQPYQAKVPPDGGAPSTWGLSAGHLPDGLDLGVASGRITGTPRKVGTFEFTVERRDNATARTAREDLSIRIMAGRVASATRWSGTYEYRLDQRVPAGQQLSTARVTIRLAEDASGVLKGTADGPVTADLFLSNCQSRTVRPAQLHAELAGTRTPARMDLHPVSQTYGPIQISPCYGRTPGVIGGGRIYKMEEALKTLTSQDGREYRFHGRRTYPSGPSSFTVTHDIVLRREP